MKTINKLSDLKEYQIRFIVHQFACFVSPEELRNNLKRIYDIEVQVDLLLTMNPGIPDLCVLEDQWYKHFEYIRELLLDSLINIPVANVFDRLIYLQKIYDAASKENKVDLVLLVFEAARHETTPAFEELLREVKRIGDQGPIQKKFEA